MTSRIETRLRELGLALPAQCTPRGNFLPYRVEGGLVFLAGQICEWNGAVPYTGPVVKPGIDPAAQGGVDMAAGRKAAEICALNLLFHLRDACGGQLDKVARIVRVAGYVNCLSGFDQSPAVINGASDLFIALLGEDGRHARTAIGVAGLPANAAVEVDAVIALHGEGL